MSYEWDNFWLKQHDIKVSWSKKRIIKILEKYVATEMKVLDAGCGSGFFSKYFIDRGCETYSLDFSEQALELARKMTSDKSEQYLCEDLLNEEFALRNESKFDVIFSDGLFEHFNTEEQNRLFSNFLIMNKGYIITFVPNKYTLWRMLQPFYMHGIKERPFSLSELSDLYERNECTVVERGGLNVLPIKTSPDASLGRYFGMLVYCVGNRQD